MLHSFSVENFYCFAEEAFADFEVRQVENLSNLYCISPAGTYLSKIGCVIGSNASGKTTILKGLPFLKWLIVDAFLFDKSFPIPVFPFFAGRNKKLPIKLSVSFELDNTLYSLFLELFQNKIFSEELKVKSKTKKNFTQKTLYKKQWIKEDNQYAIKATKFKLPKGLDKDLLQRNNAALIGMAKHFGHDLSEKIVSYWENIYSNVTESGRSQDTISPKNTNVLDESWKTFDFYLNNPKLKQEAEKLLSRFDIGFDSLFIFKEQTEGITKLKVGINHYLDGQLTTLSLTHASEGTKQLLFLLKLILQALERGGVVVLDEFESSLHPDIALALFHLFVSPETNPNNAQLFFGTHNHRILADLDKYQIFIAEKGKNGHASLFRLDELNVRPDENYYAKYIAGVYGGVPNIT